MVTSWWRSTFFFFHFSHHVFPRCSVLLPCQVPTTLDFLPTAAPLLQSTHNTSETSPKCWVCCISPRRSLSAYIQSLCLGSLDAFSLDIISRHGKGCAQKPQTFSKPPQDLPQSDNLSRQRSPEDGACGWETSDLKKFGTFRRQFQMCSFSCMTHRVTLVNKYPILIFH